MLNMVVDRAAPFLKGWISLRVTVVPLVLPAVEILHHANPVRVAARIVVDGPQPAFPFCVAEKVSGDPVEQLSQAAPLIPRVPSMKGDGGFKKTRTALPQLFLN